VGMAGRSQGGSMSLYARFLREVASTKLPAVPDRVEVIASSQLASLPEPAQRYLRFMPLLEDDVRQARPRPHHPWPQQQIARLATDSSDGTSVLLPRRVKILMRCGRSI
jgi:hypothetical protein